MTEFLKILFLVLGCISMLSISTLAILIAMIEYRWKKEAKMRDRLIMEGRASELV